jgi:hypothetical protein
MEFPRICRGSAGRHQKFDVPRGPPTRLRIMSRRHTKGRPMTRRGFPIGAALNSTRRTKEVRCVGCYRFAGRFRRRALAEIGEEQQRMARRDGRSGWRRMNRLGGKKLFLGETMPQSARDLLGAEELTDTGRQPLEPFGAIGSVGGKQQAVRWRTP